MIAPHDAVACSNEQHARLLQIVRLGQLFELMDRVEEGSPTLCPASDRIRRRDPPIHVAAECGNHSMVRFLWERALQREWEVESLLPRMVWRECVQSWAIAKYLIRKGFPLRDVDACPIFASHDDELIHLALENGLCVREPEGFADALSATAHSKHLLRLFRELKSTYPDLETEGLLALRKAVKEGKVRAAALLTSAGVDPLHQFPLDPYCQPDSSDPSDEPCLSSALDELRLNEKTLDMLKALKLRLNSEVWLRFFRDACWLDPKMIPEVYHWLSNPDDILLAHPERAAKLATDTLKHLRGWYSSSREDEIRRIEICEYLALLGVPLLVTESDYDVRRLRQSFGGASETRILVRFLWVIHWKGDEAQQARLKEVIRTPKMQSLVREHDPFLLSDLGLGPKRLLKEKVSKRHRPWHPDSYKPPRPFELPPKEKAVLRIPPESLYQPADPTPVRRGYWDRWSHFHR